MNEAYIARGYIVHGYVVGDSLAVVPDGAMGASALKFFVVGGDRGVKETISSAKNSIGENDLGVVFSPKDKLIVLVSQYGSAVMDAGVGELAKIAEYNSEQIAGAVGTIASLSNDMNQLRTMYYSDRDSVIGDISKLYRTRPSREEVSSIAVDAVDLDGFLNSDEFRSAVEKISPNIDIRELTASSEFSDAVRQLVPTVDSIVSSDAFRSSVENIASSVQLEELANEAERIVNERLEGEWGRDTISIIDPNTGAVLREFDIVENRIGDESEYVASIEVPEQLVGLSYTIRFTKKRGA